MDPADPTRAFPLEALLEAAEDASRRDALTASLEEILVWGTLVGWEMLGSPVHILFCVEELGFAFPPGSGEPVHIFVNPRVLVQPRGEELLKGLILHELGHHWAHFSGPDHSRADRLARGRNLKGLYNLVLDEHLERGLRSRATEWGEYLDALASWVFKGRPSVLTIEEYAAVFGLPTSEEAVAALATSECPGEVISWQHGYAVDTLGIDWVSFDNFLGLMFQEVKRRCDIDASAVMDAAEAELRAKAQALRGDPLGILSLVKDHPLFRTSGERGVTVARLSLMQLVGPLSEEEARDERLFLRNLEKRLAGVAEAFPRLKRYYHELEVALGSRWFWPKQRAMVHNMRLGFDPPDTFLPAVGLSSKELKRILHGNMKPDPAVVLPLILEEWSPRCEVNPALPYQVRLRWVETLSSPLTPPFTKFVVCLRLGLGLGALSGDAVARQARSAIPRNLKSLGNMDLLGVTFDVAKVLGPDARDPERPKGARRKSKIEPEEAEAGRGTGLGNLMNRALAEARKEICLPLGDGSLTPALKRALDDGRHAAANKIREWLRTGTKPEVKKVSRRWDSIRRPPPKTVLRVDLGQSPECGSTVSGELPHHLLNVAQTCGFDPIRTIGALPQAQQEYDRYKGEQKALIRSLRRFLGELGLGQAEAERSLVGRRADPAALRTLAINSDPHVLVGREDASGADLFLGLAIDCSSSMCAGDSMDRAISFGVLLLEAAKGLPGLSCRAMGFDDSILYDLGGPGSTSVAGLTPGGGNNDAAALLHLAHLAELSRKSRKFLIMISDGYPTACSLEALRTLVRLLGQRYRLVCAQVAVAGMDEERSAFPHFTDLSRAARSTSVRQFGRLLQRLVARQCG